MTINRYILSYPRSGQHWLVGMWECTVTGRRVPSTWFKRGDIPRGFNVTHDASVFFRPPRRRRGFNPEYDVMMDAQYAGADVFHLIRDPRDCSCSLWAFHTYRRRRRQWNKSGIASFLRSGSGVPYHVAHLNRWARLRASCARYETLRYEDLHADPEAGFAQFCAFFSVDVSADRIRDIVNRCNVRAMREFDRQGLLWGRKRKSGPKDNPLSGFCVQGRPRAWLTDPRLKIDDATRDWVETYIRENLHDDYRYYKSTAADTDDT